MDIFELRRKKVTLMKAIRRDSSLKVKSNDDAENIFITCPVCEKIYAKTELINNYHICPSCGYHHKIGAYERIEMIADTNTFKEINSKMTTIDILKFPDYNQEIKNAKRASGLNEAYVYGLAEINSMPAVVGVLDSKFIMGSMGVTVGEKVSMSVELAGKRRIPLIIFTASGGARMHEGTVSLMQMAKTSAVIKKFSDNGGLYIAYLTNPTTGGVTASFASLGDITLAEPQALIGFAGPRVIEQTIGDKLPEGFQTSEYLLTHGFIDQIVGRDNMRTVLTQLLMLHERRHK